MISFLRLNLLLPVGMGIFLISLLNNEEQTGAHKKMVEENGHIKKPVQHYKWTRLSSAAPFPQSYNFQLFSFRDTLWAFHSQGNWYSRDGRTWTQSVLPNSIHNLAFLDYLQFDHSIWGLGILDGNIEKFSFSSTVSRTWNMKNWIEVSDSTRLPRRFFYHPFVFQNKIWIIGGSDGQKNYADIWNSENGKEWQRVRDQLPFGPRANSQVVELNHRLFLLNNDVWSSADGLNWVKLTDEIVPGQEIFGYAALEFDQRIWLLGCTRNGQFTSKVLSSLNGKDWEGMEAPWSPRGGIAACVFNGKILMTGGKYGGVKGGEPDFVYSNDVWCLEKLP